MTWLSLRTVRILSRASALTGLAALSACGGSEGPAPAGETSVGESASPQFRQFELAAGVAHACSLTGGRVKCWGSNDRGQLGDGSLVDSVHPVAVSLPLRPVMSIASNPGAEHTCALLNTGTVYCWGRNDQGQLGDGTRTDRPTPVPVAGLTGVRSIAVGGYFTCAVVAAGEVRCWGANDTGGLGNGTQGAGSATPVAVAGIAEATMLALGDGHACALLGVGASGGRVMCWGYNGWGQVGSGVAASIPTNGQLTPVAVVGLTNATAIFAGGQYTCATLGSSTVSSSGPVECWGRDDSGELGTGSMSWFPVPAPVVVPNLTAFTLATGGSSACAMPGGGRIDCWGDNGSGQFGDGTRTSSFGPVVSGFNDPSGYSSVAVGASFICAWPGSAGSSPVCSGFGGDPSDPLYSWLSSTVPVAIQ